jgi:CheY-like chemotaxis protein
MVSQAAPPRRPKILIMDDSEIVLAVTRTALENHGFDVRVANSLGEFNVILKTWLPTIVLTDVNMPGVTGPELCRWIKIRIETESVPVVLFSDLPENRLARLAEESGADAFCSKGAGVEQLSRKLSELCEEMVW